MDRYNELIELIKTFQKDFEKFYERENKTAGIRLRKDMQKLRQLAKNIRNEIQVINNERLQKKANS